MLDIEKMAKKSRRALLTISFIGVLVFAVGLALTLTIVLKTPEKDHDWTSQIAMSAGPMVLLAFGLLIACMPWGILQVVGVLLRQSEDERFSRGQFLGAMETQDKILAQIREIASLSDAAKQVAYRAKDLEALLRSVIAYWWSTAASTQQ